MSISPLTSLPINQPPIPRRSTDTAAPQPSQNSTIPNAMAMSTLIDFPFIFKTPFMGAVYVSTLDFIESHVPPPVYPVTHILL